MLDYALGNAPGQGGHRPLRPPENLRRRRRPPGPCTGADSLKDQSYVLYGLEPGSSWLRVRFPLWGYGKEEVRALAREASPARGRQWGAWKPRFVPISDHAAFIEWHTGRRAHAAGRFR
ncbi:MAG: hypothetical protein ACLU9S_04190 [Oscillospiraceae bacterium]